MKKLILASLAALALVPSSAMAQSYGELRHDRRDIREARQDVREAKQDVREARREYRDDLRDYNRAHPWRAAPFKYQRFQPGYRITPAFYGRNYVINDYRRFHWAAPKANERWVRHYDDALLVNIRTGRVVKVVHNVFR